MKKALNILLSWLLAVSVLFASTGVVIASHVCLKLKKSDVSLFESKSCCSKHDNSCSPAPVIKKKCCQLSVSYHKLEVSTLFKTASVFDGFSVPVMNAVMTASGNSSIQYVTVDPGDPPGNLRQIPGSKYFLHSIHLLLI